MTYLELVNSVLVRLREEQVATVNESDYSAMVGAFVNDAKRLVEDAWDWTALRDTYSFDTVQGTSTYVLPGYSTRSKLISVYNTTDNAVIGLQSLEYIRQKDLGSEGAEGNIINYVIDGVDSNGDIKLRFYAVPNAIKSMIVNGVKRSGELSNDSDESLVPYSPIIQWAYSYALRERGETGGQSGAEQAIFAQNDLATAISLDAANHQEELIWNYI